jgi:hypothetical protein
MAPVDLENVVWLSDGKFSFIIKDIALRVPILREPQRKFFGFVS